MKADRALSGFLRETRTVNPSTTDLNLPSAISGKKLRKRKRREETAANSIKWTRKCRRKPLGRSVNNLEIQTRPIANKKLGRMETATAQQATEAANIGIDIREPFSPGGTRRRPVRPRHPATKSICARPPGITVADQNKTHPNATASSRCRILEGV
jgi:hypothetical protein